MAHSYGFKKVQAKKFIIARTFRLYPLHLFMFTMFFLLQLVMLAFVKAGINFSKSPFEGAYALREIIPNLLFLQSWLPGFNPLSWNMPAWSLSVEYYVYMIFLVTMLATLLAGSKIKYFLWLALATTALWSLMQAPEFMSQAASGILCFFVGALGYSAYRKINVKIDQLNSKAFTIIEAVLLFLIFYIVSYVDSYKEIYALLLFVLTIFIFAFERGVFSHLLQKPLFQLFGKLSYSIYMTHVLVIFCLKTLIQIIDKLLKTNFTVIIDGSARLNFDSSIIGNLVLFATILTVLIVATFTYKYIEMPGQKLGKKIIQESSLKQASTS